MNHPFDPIHIVSNALDDIALLLGPVEDVNKELSNGIQIIVGLGMESLARELQSWAQDIHDGIFKVVALGEFKTGKSTLLNALVGKNLLPARATASTAIISVLHHGEAGQVELMEHGVSRQISQAEFLETYQLSSQDAGNPAAYERFRHIDYVRIAHRHGLLQHGVQLIDAPGLGEHSSRTKLTLGFLRQAQAILFVTRANALSQETIAAIEPFTIGDGYQPHIFFIINRIDQVDSADDIQSYAATLLESYFVDSKGIFNHELFQQRVFFTNAKAALKERLSARPDQQALQMSGIPRLEQELMAALEGSGRSKAVVAAAYQLLRGAVFEAARMIDAQEVALEHPLGRDEHRQQAVAKHLTELSKRIDILQHDLERHNQAIVNRVYSDLVQYIAEMKDSWTDDARRMIKFDKGVFEDIASIPFSGSKRIDIERRIDEQLRNYLDMKFTQWQSRVPNLLEPELQAMVRTIERHSRIFRMRLGHLEAAISGQPMPGFATEWSQRVMSKVSFQSLKPALTNRQFYSSGSSIEHMANNIALSIVVTLLTKDGLLGALFGATLENLRRVGGSGPHKFLIERIGEALFHGLREELSTRRQELYTQFEVSLTYNSAQIVKLFQDQIVEVQKRLDSLKLKHGVNEQTTKQELRRLATLREQLLIVLNKVGAQLELAPMNTELLQQAMAEAAAADATEIDSYNEEAEEDEEQDWTGSSEEEESIERNKLVATLTKGFQQVVSDAMRPAEDASILRLLSGFDRLTGLKSVRVRLLDLAFFQAERKQRIEAKITASKEPPTLHLVFTGNPGTGKTKVASLIAPVYYDLGLLPKDSFVEAKITDLISRFIGGSSHDLKVTFEKAIGGVLFIDEAYQLSETHIYGSEAINMLNDLMEKHRSEMMVIVAGYPDKMKHFFDQNPGLAARFPKSNYIEFPDYTPDELMKILEDFLKDDGYTIDPDSHNALLNVVENMYAIREQDFGNAREMRNLAQDLIMHRARRRQQNKAKLPIDAPISAEDIPEKYANYVHQAVFRPEAILEELDRDLVGLHGVKTTIKELVMQLKYDQEYPHEDAPRPQLHMVFVGAPGTGKTTVARMLGRILRSLGYLRKGHLIELKYHDFTSQYIGGSAARTIEHVHLALDGVLFIDEAYTMQNDSQGREVINTLLVEMENQRDRLVVILAGYTNEMESLLEVNPGLRSRIGLRLEFPSYTSDQLRHLLQRQAMVYGLSWTDLALVRALHHLAEQEKHDRRVFGNGRAVRLLVEIIKRRLALKIMSMEASLERDRIARIIHIEDVPDPQLVHSIVSQGRQRYISEGQRINLDLELPDAAADRSR